jgi:hypothetical protein
MYRTQAIGLLAGLAALLAVSFLAGTSTSTSIAANFLIFLSFEYVFFHWNNMGGTARRVRLVRELSEAPAGLTIAELLSRYSAREILDRRLGRMIASGQLIERNGRLYPGNPSVLTVARIVGLLKLILGPEQPRP